MKKIKVVAAVDDFTHAELLRKISKTKKYFELMKDKITNTFFKTLSVTESVAINFKKTHSNSNSQKLAIFNSYLTTGLSKNFSNSSFLFGNGISLDKHLGWYKLNSMSASNMHITFSVCPE